MSEYGQCHAQAVVVTDPYLVSEVLGKDREIEKSIEGVYSKFNVVGAHMEGQPQPIFSTDAFVECPLLMKAASFTW